MITTQLTLDDIIQMTLYVGEDWAIAHAKRLIELVKQIGGELPYDAHVMELAAYMHDWGALPKYIQKDVEHAVRSRQVVESDILPHLPLTADQKEILLETIELQITVIYARRNRTKHCYCAKRICSSSSA